MYEPLEDAANARYTIEPIQYPLIYNMYNKAVESQWEPAEVYAEMSKDAAGWVTLPPNVQRLIKSIVAFFAISDGVVGEVISEELNARIQIKEFKMWYNHQAMMEDVHGIVYSQLVLAYVSDHIERANIFNAIKTSPSIQAKVNWIHKWVGRDNPLRHLPKEYRATLKESVPETNIQLRADLDEEPVPLGQVILANIITEGIFFSGSFGPVFWVSHYYGVILPGLKKANEWISRDEGMHVDNGVLIYLRYIVNKLPLAIVHTMFSEATNIEIMYVRESIPENLKGLNANLMSDYIKFCADVLLHDLSVPLLYNVRNPIPECTNKQSISVRIPDFFADQNVSEYGRHDNGEIGYSNGFSENF